MCRAWLTTATTKNASECCENVIGGEFWSDGAAVAALPDMTQSFRLHAWRWWVSAGLASLLAVAPASAKPRAKAPVDRSVREATKHGSKTVRVIVRVAPDSRLALKRAWSKGTGRTLRREHGLISALTLDIPANAVDALSEAPGVLSVSIDAPIAGEQLSGVLDGVTQTAGALFTPQTISLAKTLGLTWADPRGQGVTIGIVDSGIAPSAEFGDRIKAFYDFTSGGVVARAPYDNYGHGTHVAGLIAGSGAGSNGAYAGVAPAAALVGLKVLDGTGAGYTSDLIDALEFATTNKAALGIDILNLSLGHPPYEPAATDPLVAAVDRASAAGILVIVSAGNAGVNPTSGLPGYGGVMSPGNARSALTVGAENTMNTATRRDDLVAPYSSRGPTWYDGYAKPVVVAPGQ
jgi:serine protease AprX